MRLTLLAAVSAAPLAMFSLVGPGDAQTPEGVRVSGPVVHENLAIYFIHGKSAPGKVPLTLEEALAKGVVKVRETSNVNQLEIENLGDEEVFVQSGDIVKGGKQDRTLMVSLILPPKSGSIPIASFCVEEGRWSARGREDARNFATASASVPSRELKLAMKARAYVDALKSAGGSADDIIGFAFAINGTLNSADVYPSNGLFRKMWVKLLNASAIEAIGHKSEPNVAPPAIDKVKAFLAEAEAGKAKEKPLNASVKLETREADAAYLFETSRGGSWVHRNYLAR
jgi:hypothetical protein